MSAVAAINAQGESALLSSGHADDFLVLSGRAINQRFTARIDVVESIDPDMPLGADPRMVSILRVMKDGPKLGGGDLLRTDPENARYKVVALVDNNAESTTTDYRVEQQL